MAKQELELRSPLSWVGGKYRLRKYLVQLLPKHTVYVEVFGGGAQLLFAKPPSPVEVYNDVDGDLVNFFRVLRDEEKFDKFYRKVACTPFSREEYEYCLQSLHEPADEIERAYRWYITVRMSFGSMPGSGWGFAKTPNRLTWLGVIEKLPEIHRRVMNVYVDNRDFRELIPAYDTPDTLFYCDPPYVPDTRVEKRMYKHELTAEDHEQLVDVLLSIKGKALLSGYENKIYERLEQAGWQKIKYKHSCIVAGSTRTNKREHQEERIECVWVSPNCGRRFLSFL